MKKLYHKVTMKFRKAPNSQNSVLEFVRDKKNIQKAVEGSMQKRIDLLDRVTHGKNA